MKKYKDRKEKMINRGFGIAYLTTAIAAGLKLSQLRGVNQKAVNQFHSGLINRADMLNIMQEVSDKEKTVGLIFMSVMGALFLADTVCGMCQDMKEK